MALSFPTPSCVTWRQENMLGIQAKQYPLRYSRIVILETSQHFLVASLLEECHCGKECSGVMVHKILKWRQENKGETSMEAVSNVYSRIMILESPSYPLGCNLLEEWHVWKSVERCATFVTFFTPISVTWQWEKIQGHSFEALSVEICKDSNSWEPSTFSCWYFHDFYWMEERVRTSLLKISPFM
jgi:hypothetical protein